MLTEFVSHLKQLVMKVWDGAARATCETCGRFTEWKNKELRNQSAMCGRCMQRVMR